VSEETKELPQHTQEALGILDEVKFLIENRDRQYGGSWYDYGLDGNFSHLKEKVLRFSHQMKAELPAEVSSDTLWDLIVWATFCIVCLRKKHETSRDQLDGEKYKKMYSKEHLYGNQDELTADDHFILASKFYNAIFQNYKNRQRIPKVMIEEFIVSLERLRNKLEE